MFVAQIYDKISHDAQERYSEACMTVFEGFYWCGVLILLAQVDNEHIQKKRR